MRKSLGLSTIIIEGGLMFQLMAFLAAIAEIVLAFMSALWAWAPLVVADIFLFSVFFAVKQRKWKEIPELSPEANRMLTNFGHFYAMPFAGRSVSASASLLALGGSAVAIVCAVRSSWWWLFAGFANYILIGPLGRQFNPSMFLAGNAEPAAHGKLSSTF